MKRLIFIFASLVFLIARADDFSLRNPHRLFGVTNTVDLTPMCQWWNLSSHARKRNQIGDSPMTNFVCVIGHFAKQWYGNSWIVDAEIYTTPFAKEHKRIILLNPPAWEKGRYEQLKSDYATARSISAKASSEVQDLGAASADAGNEAQFRQKMLIDYGIKPHDHVNYWNVSDNLGNKMDTARAVSEDARDTMIKLRALLDDIPKDSNGYEIDFLALQRGVDRNTSLPVYDLGRFVR